MWILSLSEINRSEQELNPLFDRLFQGEQNTVGSNAVDGYLYDGGKYPDKLLDVFDNNKIHEANKEKRSRKRTKNNRDRLSKDDNIDIWWNEVLQIKERAENKGFNSK